MLVALTPVLLMLAAVGLERLESGLGGEPTKSDDPVDDPVDDLQRRLQQRRLSTDTWPGDAQNERLPTLPYIRHRTNPEFQATGHANPV